MREILPAALRDFPFKIDMAQQDPRPLNPIGMRDRQIYVYDRATRSVSAEPLKELLKYLPGKVAQCRIFATSHEHDPRSRAALEKALVRGAPRPPHQPRTSPIDLVRHPRPSGAERPRQKGHGHGEVSRRRLLRHRRAPDRGAAHDARRRPRLGGGQVPARRGPASPGRHVPGRGAPSPRRDGRVRRHAQGLRLRRPRQRRLRAHHAGARARRLRAALVRLGAERARDVPDLQLRLRRAEGPLAPAARVGRRRSAASASPSPTTAPTPAA